MLRCINFASKARADTGCAQSGESVNAAGTRLSRFNFPNCFNWLPTVGQFSPVVADSFRVQLQDFAYQNSPLSAIPASVYVFISGGNTDSGDMT